MTNERLYTQQEVADFFGVHHKTIYNWRMKGMIQAFKVGRGLRYTQTEINRLMENSKERI